MNSSANNLTVNANTNDRFLRALARQPVDRVPVWLMRQAGRYLPEYRATRERAGSFLALAQNPQFACEVTLQPLARFPLDAAILFSDILTIPDAFGLGLHFIDGEGPRFARRIECAADVYALPSPAVTDSLRYVSDAVSLIRQELAQSVPLIGFSGAPWTLFCYMLEGGGSTHYHRAKRFMLDEAKATHALLGKLSDAVIDYLVMQAQAGAQVLMLFDSWAGLLSAPHYHEFCERYLRKIVAAVKAHPASAALPLIVFAKGANAHLASLSQLGADALGLDWSVPISLARAQTGGRVALQGNLDPAVLYAKPEEIRAQVALLLEDATTAPGHIFNLGHGMNPDMLPEHAAALVEAVHSYSIAQRAREQLA
jgi:uroporphyrinogen decarboxylase